MNWPHQFLEMKKASDVLLAHVEATYGLFHDATRGWQYFSIALEKMIESEMARGMPREQALKSILIHGQGVPNVDAVFQHESTLGDRLGQCKPRGPNEIFLGNMCVVSIYSFWEDRTRGEIATALGIEKNNVKSGLFADLAKFRHVILHAGGRADNAFKKIEVLRWFEPGDLIVVDREKLHSIIEHIRNFPEGLETPGYTPVE
jgi:hypothetical protein